MLDWLSQYSIREKAIVALAALVVVGLIIHAIIIEPYQLHVESVRGELEQQTADLAWMKSAVVRLPKAEESMKNSQISGSLANFVDQIVRKQGLSAQLSQMTPVGNDEIRMRYSAVDFNRLIGFIAQIRSSGLVVKDIRINTGNSPGNVDSSIVFSRS